MEKTFSQRVARFLEMINYFFLVPTSLIEFGVLIYGLISLLNFQFADLFLCIVITIVYAVGTLLLYGYYKHSRSGLSKTFSFCLWAGTIIFNAVPFFWLLSIWAGKNFTIYDKAAEFWFYNIQGSYLSVILLATVALISDLRREFK